MFQYASKTILVKKNDWETVCEPIQDLREGLELLSRAGISRWAHPILHFPMEPLVLVEGKYDAHFFKEAFIHIRPKRKIRVTYLEHLNGGGATGGVDQLLNYTKDNAKVIKLRQKDAPIVVVLDWDSARKANQFRKPFGADDPFKIFAWPEASFNPKLGRTFHGIERHFSDRMIEEAERRGAQIYRNRNGICSVQNDEYGEVKNTLNGIVNEGLKEEDFVHARDFIKEILRATGSHQ
jgi:hypothetical protein